jgi:hypothetical protein
MSLCEKAREALRNYVEELIIEHVTLFGQVDRDLLWGNLERYGEDVLASEGITIENLPCTIEKLQREVIDEVAEPPYSENVLEVIVDAAGWEVQDIDEEKQQVKLYGGFLYPYNSQNMAQRFLLDEHYLAEGDESLIIERLIQKGRIPIFVALDGTEYLAVEDLLPDWREVEEKEPGVRPIAYPGSFEEVFELTPEWAAEILNNPQELKRFLASVV